MKVLSNKTENRTVYLTLEVEPVEVEESMDKAYKRMVKDIEVPGFRKGNAPRDVLEKQVGKDTLYGEAKKELIYTTCGRAIKEQGIKQMTQPMVKEIKEDPLTLEMVIPLTPVVELGDYKSIRMQQEPVEITEKDIDNVMEQLRQQFATTESVDRPVEMGDTVTANLEGIVMESPFMRKNGVKIKVAPDTPPELPGLFENFVGAKKDEKKEFKFKMPDDYENKLVANREAIFKVTVTDIIAEKLPEIDDKLLKTIAPDIKTLDELRERIRANMQMDYEQKAKIKFEEDLISAVIEKSKLEVSPMMIEMEANYLTQQGLQQLQSSCKTKEEYEAKLKQVSMEKVREEYHKVAERRVYWNLVLSEVAKAEGIKINENDIEAEIVMMLQTVSGQEREQQSQYLNSPENRENVAALLAARKTVHLLTDIATSPDSDSTKENEDTKKEKKAKKTKEVK